MYENLHFLIKYIELINLVTQPYWFVPNSVYRKSIKLMLKLLNIYEPIYFVQIDISKYIEINFFSYVYISNFRVIKFAIKYFYTYYLECIPCTISQCFTVTALAFRIFWFKISHPPFIDGSHQYTIIAKAGKVNDFYLLNKLSYLKDNIS